MNIQKNNDGKKIEVVVSSIYREIFGKNVDIRTRHKIRDYLDADREIDVFVDKMGNDSDIAIECKDVSHNIDMSDIDIFEAKLKGRSERKVFVYTSDITKNAQKRAEKLDIELVKLYKTESSVDIPYLEIPYFRVTEWEVNDLTSRCPRFVVDAMGEKHMIIDIIERGIVDINLPRFFGLSKKEKKEHENGISIQRSAHIDSVKEISNLVIRFDESVNYWFKRGRKKIRLNTIVPKKAKLVMDMYTSKERYIYKRNEEDISINILELKHSKNFLVINDKSPDNILIVDRMGHIKNALKLILKICPP